MTEDSPIRPTLRVALVCTGVGIMNRGVETFFRECFDGLHGLENHEIQLWTGGGEEKLDEHRFWCLPRTSAMARALAGLARRTPYSIEQLSALLPVVRRIRQWQPDLIFYGDRDLGRWLYYLRPKLGVPYRLLYSNGGPLLPPFLHVDHVQQLAPTHYETAMLAGESPTRHSLVPLGIGVPPGEPGLDGSAAHTLRRQLDLPVDRKIVISVGRISQVHKRMHYVIEEISRLPEPRPYLVMLGAMDEATPPILSLAREKLGDGNFTARSVPYEEVTPFYQASDIFVLASLEEAFGRVYIEALLHGLPVIAHDHAVMRYVVGSQGTYADLSKPGALATALAPLLVAMPSREARIARRESVRARFGWEALAPAYAMMFQRALTG